MSSKTSKGGRPRLSPERLRSEVVEVGLNDEERRRLQHLSARRGETYAAVLRQGLLAMDRAGGRDSDE